MFYCTCLQLEGKAYIRRIPVAYLRKASSSVTALQYQNSQYLSCLPFIGLKLTSEWKYFQEFYHIFAKLQLRRLQFQIKQHNESLSSLVSNISGLVKVFSLTYVNRNENTWVNFYVNNYTDNRIASSLQIVRFIIY